MNNHTYQFEFLWAALNIHELSKEKIIQKFDNGHETICVNNDSNEILYTIEKKKFKQNFRNSLEKSFTKRYLTEGDVFEDLFSIYSSDSSANEIPITDNSKVCKIAVRRPKRKLLLYWELITEQTILSVFPKGSRILLSSLCEDTIGLVSQFSNLYDFEEYRDDCNQQEYDAFIYCADVWEQSIEKTYWVRQLFLELLLKETLAWIGDKNIFFIYIEMSTENVFDVSNRIYPGEKLNVSNIRENGFYQLCDIYEDNNVVSGGIRRTVNNPLNFQNTIYFFGPCMAIGSFTDDYSTIESDLQKELNDRFTGYRVINSGGGNSSFTVDNDINTLYRIQSTQFQKNDVIIYFGKYMDVENSNYDFVKCMKTSDIFNRKKYLKEKCFSDDCPMHLNRIGNEILAGELFCTLEGELLHNQKMIDKTYFKSRYGLHNDNEELSAYITEIEKYRVLSNTNGCIVMNCNPFTLGHMYLVNEALKKVDYLYIFIVEEERSTFLFQDRYSMAKLSCEQFSNVRILPSGKYIISAITYPEYFDKDLIQEEKVIPSLDLSIFSQYIAPALDIKIRFVGEEPYDNITRQYNATMKEMLPKAGIQIVEIPRCCINGEVVSASKVRNFIKNNNMDKMKSFLTKESYRYITSRLRD